MGDPQRKESWSALFSKVSRVAGFMADEAKRGNGWENSSEVWVFMLWSTGYVLLG